MKKIIISSISIFIVLAISITALVMGLVSVGFDANIKKPDNVFISYSTTQDLADQMLVLRERNSNELIKINAIYNYFSNGFTQKALSALFAGELNGNITTNYSAISSQVSKNYESDSKITIVFEYKESQSISVADSSVYNYNYLFFEIDNTNIRATQTLGVNASLTDFDVKSIPYKYSFNGQANFNALYNYTYGLIA